jgi:ribonuclease D
VLHAGDNDLTSLKRRYSLAFGAIFDTSLAARFLGARALGLDTLLRQHLGVELPPSRQKDDWSALKDRLVAELERIGRLAWVEEECAARAAEPVPERVADPDAWAHLKGAKDLSPRGLAVLSVLYELRDRLALAADRPPFKIFGDATLVAMARAAPRDPTGLGAIPGCTPRVVARWGHAVLDAVERAVALPESALPKPTPSPRPPAIPGAVRRQVEALRAWRTRAAPAWGLEPGVLLPNRLIRLIAEAAPRDHEKLAGVSGVRRWRVQVLGDQILGALRG